MRLQPLLNPDKPHLQEFPLHPDQAVQVAPLVLAYGPPDHFPQAVKCLQEFAVLVVRVDFHGECQAKAPRVRRTR